jgi:WD40 repeat protein
LNSKPLLKALSILFALIFLVIGVMYFIGFSSPSASFSTSYQGFPDPKPMPKDEPNTVVEVPGFIQSFDISRDGKMIVIATSRELILYNLKTLGIIHNLSVSETVYQTKFSPDGSKLAVSGFIRKYVESGPLHVTVWDTSSWNILYEYKNNLEGSIPSGALAWAPDSKRLAFSIPERGLSVIDVNAGKPVATLDDFIVSPFDLSWSPDGLRLISTGDLGYGLRRWRVDTNKWVRLFDVRPQPASQVSWSPDGMQIASGHFGGTVCIWSVANNQCEGYIKAHFNSVDALDWSPDSRQIATASGAIRIWDSHTGELKSSFGFYDGMIYKYLRWINSQIIATLETSYTQSVPSTIRFWDVSTGNMKLAFRGWDNIQGLNNGGVALELDNVQISPDRTIVQVSLHFDSPDTYIAGDWNLTMADSNGRIYPLTDITPQTMDAGVTRIYQTVPVPVGERITLDLSSFPQNGRMPLMVEFPVNPGGFTFDPSTLQIGESAELNQQIEANGYLVQLIGARKTAANELLFEFASDGSLNGAMLSSAPSNGSTSGFTEDGKITSSLSFSEMPNEPIEVEITRLYYNAFGPWLLEFQVAKSMFADLPPVTPTSTPAAQAALTFTSQEPLFLEVQSLSKKFDDSIVQGLGWVHVVSENITQSMQQGQTYPPPYYQEEQWVEIDSEGWVTRSLTTDWGVDKNILQQSISVGTHNMNLTTGEAGEFPAYRLSLDWILADLDYALNHGQTVSREETTCEDGSSCLLIAITNGDIARRTWINVETGQQVKMQTSQQRPDGTEKILFTQIFLSVERVVSPPQDILDVFSKVLLPTP